MTSIASILSALDERTIARQIGIPHDETRIRYTLQRNTVQDFDEFSRIIGDYYIHHSGSCISRGGTLSRAQAEGRAKEILERDYRRRNDDIVSAYNNAHDGTNGGLRGVLDKIAEALKAQSVERYIRSIFDRHLAPCSWEEKVQIMRDFVQHCGMHLSSSIRADDPARYAHEYSSLIRAYLTALQQTSSMFRRL